MNQTVMKNTRKVAVIFILLLTGWVMLQKRAREIRAANPDLENILANNKSNQSTRSERTWAVSPDTGDLIVTKGSWIQKHILPRMDIYPFEVPSGLTFAVRVNEDSGRIYPFTSETVTTLDLGHRNVWSLEFTLLDAPNNRTPV